MKNLNINNAIELPVIDILGDIGESWFDDPITMQDVSNQLKDIKTNFIINISSLGGSVNHGLAIHDMIKMHNSQSTAKIIGMTASAGTIVALGAKKVQMSENAMFLIHKSQVGVNGNSDDLREVADDLDTVDELIANIYVRKTGREQSFILDLMKEERWISASEALELGLIDEIINGDKINNKIYNSINNSHLPKIENMDKNYFEKIMDKLAMLGNADETLKNKITELEAENAKIADFEAKITVIEAEKIELQNKVTELEAEKETISNKVVELTNQIEALQAGATKIDANDPPIGDLSAKDKELEKLANQLGKSANLI